MGLSKEEILARKNIIIRVFKKITEKTGKFPSVEKIAEEVEWSAATINGYLDSKTMLIKALEGELEAIDSIVPEPTDDLAADLTVLAQAYWEFYSENTFLLFVIMLLIHEEDESTSDADGKKKSKKSTYDWAYQHRGKLRTITRAKQDVTIGKLQVLYEHHRKAGRWSIYIQEGGEENVVDRVSDSFLGGIFSRRLWSYALLSRAEFDADAYVRRYLAGAGSEKEQVKLEAKRLLNRLLEKVDEEV